MAAMRWAEPVGISLRYSDKHSLSLMRAYPGYIRLVERGGGEAVEFLFVSFARCKDKEGGKQMEAQGPKQKNSPSFKVAQRQMQQDSLQQQQINLMKDVNQLKNRLQQFMEVYNEMQHCPKCRDETCQHIMKEEFSPSQQNSCIKSRHVSQRQRVFPYATIRQSHPPLSSTRYLPSLSVVKFYPSQLNSLPLPKHHCWSRSNIERSEPSLRRLHTWPQTDDSRRRQTPVGKVRDTLAFSEHIDNFDEPRKDQSSSDSKRDEWLPNKADRSMQIFPDFSQGTQLTSHSAFSDLSSDQRTVMKEFSQPQTMRERNPFVKDASQDPMMSSVDIKRDRFSPDSCSEGFMLHALSQPFTEAQHFSGHSEASGHANFSDTSPLRQAPENMCVKEEHDTEPHEVQSTVEWHKGGSPEMSFSSQSSNLEETRYNFPVTESVNSEPSSQTTESDDADRQWESEVDKEDLSVTQPSWYFPKSFVSTSSETAFKTQQVRCINEWLNGNSPEMPFSSQSSNLEDTVKDLDEIVAVGSEQSYQNTESVPSNAMYYPYTYVSTRPNYSCNTVSVVSESLEWSHLKEIAYNTIERDPKSVIRTQRVGRAHRRNVKPEVFIKEPVNDIPSVRSHPKEDVVSSSPLSMSAAEGNSDKECERIKAALDHLSLDDLEAGEADSGTLHLKMRTESRETGTGKEIKSCDFQSHEGQSIDVSDNNASREKEQVNEKTVDELSTSVTLLKLSSSKNTANVTGISQASTCSAERETTPAKDFEKELPRSLERLRLEDPEDEQAVETNAPERSNEESETDFENLHKEESFNLSKMPKPTNETADTEVSKLHGAKENDEEKGQPSDNIPL